MCLLVGTWRTVFFLGAGAHVIWAALLGVSITTEPRHPGSAAKSGSSFREVARLLRDWRVVLVLTTFLIQAGGEMALTMWLPAFLETDVGYSKQTALHVLTALLAGFTLIRMLAGFRPHGPGMRFVLSCVLALAVGTTLLLGPSRQSASISIVAGFLAGVGIGWIWPSLAAVLYDHIPRNHGTVTSLCFVSSLMGWSLIGVTGVLADWVGFELAIGLSSFCCMVSALMYLLLRSHAGERRPRDR